MPGNRVNYARTILICIQYRSYHPIDPLTFTHPLLFAIERDKLLMLMNYLQQDFQKNLSVLENIIMTNNPTESKVFIIKFI